MRLFTTLVIVCLCGFAMWRGWEVAAFAAMERSADATTADGLQRWTRIPGVSEAAMEKSLTLSGGAAGGSGAARRLDILNALLRSRPLSSTRWLSLAGARAMSAAPPGEVGSALRMSYLTGPNEGAIALQRGIFGLLEWEMLSPDMRMETARDLTAAAGQFYIPEQTAQIITGVLRGKPAETQTEIRAMLEASRMTPEQAARLGLGQ
jgi:hypothetical protein